MRLMNQSLLKSLQIFEMLMRSEGPCGVNELSRMLGMSKSTVGRLLATLQWMGFVRRDAKNGKFHLGLKLFELGCRAIDDLGLREVALPLMEKLRDTLNEKVLLIVLEDTHITYLEKLESRHPIIIQTNVGSTAPAYCVSSGKLLLAYDPRCLEKVISQGLKPHTRNTITDPDRLHQECAKARKLGYATSKSELCEGICGVSAPIFNATGRAVAAISTSTPVSRMPKRRLREHIDAVKRTAQAISRQLGAPVNVSPDTDLS